MTADRQLTMRGSNGLRVRVRHGISEMRRCARMTKNSIWSQVQIEPGLQSFTRLSPE